jgi:hypothetical protein
LDTLSFDKTIQVVHVNKNNTIEILDKHNMLPKHKAQINIPFYKMISMFIVHPTLQIDVLKMEHAFHSSYREGDKVFYVSPLN